MTRAKERLYFSAADFYSGAKRKKKISPFVFEALGKVGYEVKTKDLQIFPGGAKKGDWDVGISVEFADKFAVHPQLMGRIAGAAS